MEKINFTHGSLFSGIGGFDLAAQWVGWENVFHCEWNPFGQKILKHYWPKAKSYEDITRTDFTIHRGRIDILTGGFPCQPYSSAGKRLGKEDDRHLWPEMLRAIREIEPRWIVGENVRGLVNWNGGLVFDEVQTDLESEGYEVLPVLLPASSLNAPHQRERVWFVAYSSNFRCDNGRNNRKKRHIQNDINRITEENKSERNGRFSRFGEVGNIRNAANTDSRRQSSEKHRQTKSGRFAEKSISNHWENFPTQSPICNGNDGVSFRLDGITFPKWRNESIKGGGNAIVPQVVFEIFKVINEMERTWKK
jgi:DNA (cytosine-5)-methyltransferase 1